MYCSLGYLRNVDHAHTHLINYAVNNILLFYISYSYYLKQVCINKSFYLRPATADEIHDTIKSMDLNKSLGPNSINHEKRLLL